MKRSNSYEVRAHVEQLMHGMIVHLDKLYLLFESREAVRSFSIDYRLLAANLPEKVAGKLHVVTES
jgi:hypothetical protein